jgi:hypothetical protein
MPKPHQPTQLARHCPSLQQLVVSKIHIFAPVTTPLPALKVLELAEHFIAEGAALQSFRIAHLAPCLTSLSVQGLLRPESMLEGSERLHALSIKASALGVSLPSLDVLATCAALKVLNIRGSDGMVLLRTLSPGNRIEMLTLYDTVIGFGALQHFTPALLPTLYSLHLYNVTMIEESDLIALAALPRLVEVQFFAPDAPEGHMLQRSGLALLSMLPKIEFINCDAFWISREFMEHCERMAPSGRLRISVQHFWD